MAKLIKINFKEDLEIAKDITEAKGEEFSHNDVDSLKLELSEMAWNTLKGVGIKPNCGEWNGQDYIMEVEDITEKEINDSRLEVDVLKEVSVTTV